MGISFSGHVQPSGQWCVVICGGMVAYESVPAHQTWTMYQKKKKRWNEMEWFEGLDREIAVVEFHGVKPTMDAQRLQ